MHGSRTSKVHVQSVVAPLRLILPHGALDLADVLELLEQSTWPPVLVPEWRDNLAASTLHG